MDVELHMENINAQVTNIYCLNIEKTLCRTRNFPGSQDHGLRQRIYRPAGNMKGKIENLLGGKTLDIQIHEEVTYEYMCGTGENL